MAESKTSVAEPTQANPMMGGPSKSKLGKSRFSNIKSKLGKAFKTFRSGLGKFGNVTTAAAIASSTAVAILGADSLNPNLVKGVELLGRTAGLAKGTDLILNQFEKGFDNPIELAAGVGGVLAGIGSSFTGADRKLNESSLGGTKVGKLLSFGLQSAAKSGGDGK